MARKCKCKICNKELTTDIAYKSLYNNKNIYCCNQDEYETWIKNKENYIKILECIDDILGYKSTNTLILKEIKQLHSVYEYYIILKCVNDYRQYIKEWIYKKAIQEEYQKIRYMMTIIKNNLADYVNIKHENKESTIAIEIDTLDNNFKYKEKRNINYFDFL